MIAKHLRVLVSCMVISATVAMGATVGIPDTLDPTVTNEFVLADGTLVSTNGVLIVFEGQLTFDTNITAVVDGSDRVLASTQLYVQMKLFDSLPSVESFTNAQAAVLGVFDNGSSTVGTLYALNGSGTSASWLQLTNAAAPIAVSEGATNLITVVLRYPGTGFTSYEYTVALSSPDAPTQIVSQTLTSPLTTETGITGLSVVGEGGLVSVASTAGDPAPLSARVDFSIYQSADGLFLVDIYTVDENGSGNLEVYAWIDGEWVLIGTAVAVGSGSNHYQFTVSGLTVGDSYLFKVVDEEGRAHLSNGEIEVKSLEMDAVQLTLETFVIEFNSEDGQSYSLLIASDVAAPAESWTVEEVQVNGDQGWTQSMTTFQGSAGGRTQIRVPRNREKAFFRIILINEAAENLNIR